VRERKREREREKGRKKRKRKKAIQMKIYRSTINTCSEGKGGRRNFLHIRW